jgi:hypothetical protein
MREYSGRVVPKAFWLLAAMLVIFIPGHALGENIVRLKSTVVVPSGNRVDSAVAIGGDVRVDGFVKEDAVALGGSVFLGPRAVVGGNVVSVGGVVSKQEGAQVDGETTVVDISRATSFLPPFSRGWRYWPYSFPTMPSFIPLLGFATLTLLLTALAPRMIGFISTTIEQGPVSSFFWGILGSASIFPVAFLLLISIIGIVLIPFQLLLVGICLYLGYVSMVQLIGKKILMASRVHDKPMILETLLGMIVLWLVSQAPFVGWLFISTAMVAGFGGVMVSLFKRLFRDRQPAVPA